MTGAIYLVTGCSRGLGIEFAKQILERGDSVIATCRSAAGAVKLRSAVDAFFSGKDPKPSNFAHCVDLDVADAASIDALPAELDKRGIAHIDVLVHNAGISAPTHPVDPIASATKPVIMSCFETNAVGPMLLTQALLPRLRAGSGKKLFFVSTVMASMQSTTAGGSVSYRASKAALQMVGRCFAGEHGIGTQDNLTVTLCHPGWCDTDMGSAGDRSPPVQPAGSVAGMLKVIDNMGPHSVGNFVDYNGAVLNW